MSLTFFIYLSRALQCDLIPFSLLWSVSFRGLSIFDSSLLARSATKLKGVSGYQGVLLSIRGTHNTQLYIRDERRL